MKNRYTIIGIGLLVLCAIALCFRAISEPDIWWQIETGRWILSHGEVPKNDVFSYTWPEVEWINVKWLSELLMAGLSNRFGIEILPVLQLLVLLMTGYFLFRTSRICFPRDEKEPFPLSVFLITGIVFLFAVSFRLNARPEMFGYLFSAIAVFLFLHQYRNPASRLAFFLIPLQIFWANMHESFGTGIVLAVLFLAGYGIEYLRADAKNRKINSLLHPALLLGLVVLASAINPRGPRLILHSFNILGQLSQNQFTTELVPITEPEYWNAFSLLNLLVFAFTAIHSLKADILPWWRGKKTASFLGVFYYLIFVAFCYLSLSAFRNIPFFQIIAFLPFMRYMREKWGIQSAQKMVFPIALSAILYLTVVSNLFYNQPGIRGKYGLEVDVARNPYGSARFIQEKGIKGKAFTDYWTSSFLLYYLSPDFKTFLDLRDLDIFPKEFIENNFRVYQVPETQLQSGEMMWDWLVKEDNYDYLVILNQELTRALQRHIYHKDPRFVLAFADGVSNVYLKKEGANADFVSKMDTVNPRAQFYHNFSPYPASGYAVMLSYIFNPFFKRADYSDPKIQKAYLGGFQKYMNYSEPGQKINQFEEK